MAAPGRQGSQVISRSENPQARSQDALFSSKKLTTFSVVALKTQAANAADCFTVKIKQIKRSHIVNILSEHPRLRTMSSPVRLSSVCNVRAPYLGD